MKKVFNNSLIIYIHRTSQSSYLQLNVQVRNVSIIQATPMNGAIGAACVINIIHKPIEIDNGCIQYLSRHEPVLRYLHVNVVSYESGRSEYRPAEM